MKKSLLSLALTTGLFVAATPVAFAVSPNHVELPSPESKNCRGLTVAALAQAGEYLDIHGIGNLADAAQMSVKELHQVAANYCAGS